MDYCVRDSSILPDYRSLAVLDSKDSCVRIGIVRQENKLVGDIDGYLVEVQLDGRQIPVICQQLVKFGGPHNFEEFKYRPWSRKVPSTANSPLSASTYDLRSGDVVLVAFINGKSREGVILGALQHPSRKVILKSDQIEYASRYNGLETQIRKDGSYRVVFNGLPLNDTLLDAPPGVPLIEAKFNPLTSGSFFGFDSDGSYIASDGSQYLKMKKSIASGSIVLVSGKNRIDLGGNKALGTMGLKTDSLVTDSKKTSIKSALSYKVETLSASIKATKMAIGSSQFELFDGLSQLIDAIGSIVITSPTGTCAPIQTSPQWVSKIIPLQIKIKSMIGSLESADSLSPSDEGDVSLGDSVGT